jgi:hypothetical protein
MTPTPLPPHFHVGIVVPDIERARATLTRQLGVTWGPVISFDPNEVRDASGVDLSPATKLCYSVEAPRLELIEEVPGTVWECNEHSNLHHIGFWSDDFDGHIQHLVGTGCPLQLCGRAGDTAPVSFTYHGNDLGVRIEILDAALRPTMEELLFLLSAPDTGA